MSIDLDVSYDKAKMEALAAGLVAMPRQLMFARTRALRKTGTFVKNQVKKAAAKSLRIPQRSIADRFYLSRIKPGDDAATLWIGTWNVDPHSIGTIRSSIKSRVLYAGTKKYQGAFYARISSSKYKVWIRKRSRHYSPDLYPVSRRKNQGSVPPELRHRFPVVRAAVPIDGVLQKVIRRDEAEIAARFKKTLLQEINYEVNVRPNRGK